MARHLLQLVSAAALAAFLSTAVYAQAIEIIPELKKVVEGAKTEGKLRIETLPDVLAGAEGLQAATGWMKREFNIDVEGSFVPNPAFAQHSESCLPRCKVDRRRRAMPTPQRQSKLRQCWIEISLFQRHGHNFSPDTSRQISSKPMVVRSAF